MPVGGLVAEIKRSDLKDLNSSFHTVRISAPNLGNRARALLGNLTNPGFRIVEQGSYLYRSTSRAVSMREDPTITRIQHSVKINITPTNTVPPCAPDWLNMRKPTRCGFIHNAKLGALTFQ